MLSSCTYIHLHEVVKSPQTWDGKRRLLFVLRSCAYMPQMHEQTRTRLKRDRLNARKVHILMGLVRKWGEPT